MRLKPLLILCLATSGLLSACAKNNEATTTLSSSQSPTETNSQIASRWMNYLANDARKGRATGSQELAEVRTWLQHEYTAMGLASLPNTQSFLQEFKIVQEDGTSLAAANVLGYIDCQCDNTKAIMIGAHYDHIGVDLNAENDTIFNGADDDASGVVASMLVARELIVAQAKGAKLPFNIIIAAWDAEELGLLGSKHFVKNPLFPLANIETGLMFELVGVPLKEKLNNAWMTGNQYSSLYPLMQQGMANAGWQLEPNPFPSMGLFMRSDNAPFALMDFSREKQIKVFRENKKVDIQGLPLHGISIWRGQEHYHQASDEASIIDISNLTSLAEAVAITLQKLDPKTQVTWKENSSFNFSRPTQK